MRIEFTQQGTFQALYAAQAWCRKFGISFGQSCCTGPTGLLFGEYDWIAKWRNLTPKERSELHGTMDGDFREGPVVITLKDAAVEMYGGAIKAACVPGGSSEVGPQSAISEP